MALPMLFGLARTPGEEVGAGIELAPDIGVGGGVDSVHVHPAGPVADRNAVPEGMVSTTLTVAALA